MKQVEQPEEVEELKSYFQTSSQLEENKEQNLEGKGESEKEEIKILNRNTSVDEIMDIEKKRIDKFMEKKLQ
eukprot:CAMPEP_0205813478 /NCGR_PEP_ID=MMETSP0205-20121125/18139_1 /ASSEMBLY_ACC=CAM_ASM_000278 /TAXON_ID=36767 /ORGANISM="Euplotes focardii, Strain TN1" /LENGTH=71 /DNA_ID=CAMNT_0053095611 /DNA_START=438 /DNA_END=650 /DNA_ORIENTATION=+